MDFFWYFHTGRPMTRIALHRRQHPPEARPDAAPRDSMVNFRSHWPGREGKYWTGWQHSWHSENQGHTMAIHFRRDPQEEPHWHRLELLPGTCATQPPFGRATGMFWELDRDQICVRWIAASEYMNEWDYHCWDSGAMPPLMQILGRPHAVDPTAAALVTIQDHRLATHALGDMRGPVAAMAVTASIAG